jgi:hypothetical protein
VRILLDENVPVQLVPLLPGHQVDAVVFIGWSGTKNGDLLRRAAGEYDVLITMDRALANEQRIPSSLAVMTLRASNNRVESVLPLAQAILLELDTILAGEHRVVGP